MQQPKLVGIAPMFKAISQLQGGQYRFSPQSLWQRLAVLDRRQPGSTATLPVQ